MHNSCLPLVIGTAQLGLPYGIANKTGQPNQSAATAIVREAWESGIREFDTAQRYGISEQVLGKALSELGISKEAKVISKLDPDLNHLDASTISDAIGESLEKLGVHSLFGIMLHNESLLSLWDKGLSEILFDVVSSKRVKHLGVSVYSPDKAIQSLNTEGIDMVQLPASILDRRFENAGVFQLANKNKKQIYIRSIFLQGLILMNVEEIPEELSFIKPILEKLESLSIEFGLTKKEIAIGYLKSEMPEARIIFGVETQEQVRENAAAWGKKVPDSLSRKVKEIFVDINERALNPTLWPA